MMELARELIALLAAVPWIGLLALRSLSIFGIPMAFGLLAIGPSQSASCKRGERVGLCRLFLQSDCSC